MSFMSIATLVLLCVGIVAVALAVIVVAVFITHKRARNSTDDKQSPMRT